MSRLRIAVVTLLALAGGAASAEAATIAVTTTADVVANDGKCSLREAVYAARYDGPVQGCTAGTLGDDLIQLEAGEYRLAAGGANEDNNESGDLDTGPASTLRIIGRGMGTTVIGAAGDRVFDVFSGASLGLTDLTVRDGVAPEGGSGGAVRNTGTLTALRVAFVNNAAGDGHTPENADDESGASGGGGAIASEGRLQVADSLFSANRAGKGGDGREFAREGGVRGFGPGAGGNGGAVLVSAGTASLTGITVTASHAGDGGDIGSATRSHGGNGGHGGAIAETGGSATVTNATFQANRAGIAKPPLVGLLSDAVAGSGGAAAAVAPGALAISFSTFSGNAVGTGPDGRVGSGASVWGATVGASVLADAGGACATLSPGALANVTLPGDVTCPGARIAGDPRLGALAANGGPVPTMLPGPGSPAIDALVGVPCPATDARGLPRPAFAGCDLGAVEVQPGSASAPGGAAGGGGGPGGAGGVGVRTLSGLTIGSAAFRATGRKPLGTNVTFRLSEAGTVVLTVRRPAAGRKSGGRCVAPTRRLRKAARCTRLVTLPGKVTKAGTAGVNVIRFSGRLRGRALAPGAYTLALTLPQAGSAPAVTALRAFRIAL